MGCNIADVNLKTFMVRTLIIAACIFCNSHADDDAERQEKENALLNGVMVSFTNMKDGWKHLHDELERDVINTKFDAEETLPVKLK